MSRLHRFAAMAILCGMGTGAMAQQQSNLCFGLDRMRWGMTLADIKRSYPNLSESQAPELHAFAVGDCRFNTFPQFLNKQLRAVILESFEAGTACRASSLNQLTAKYGKPSDASSSDHVTRLEWRKQGISVYYIAGPGLLHVAFEDPNAVFPPIPDAQAAPPAQHP